jgi:hypothetical protein
MVTQVPVIGILMIVNGSLCTLYGIMMMAMGPLIMSMGRARPRPADAEQVMWIMTAAYVGIGIVVATAGVMNIVGGMWAMRFRSRPFVLVALISNFVTIVGCHCLPTSLGLMIWGLIVMLNPDVVEGFQLGLAGYSPDEIKDRLSRRRYRDDYDDDYEDDRDSRSYDRPAPKRDQDDDGIQELK